MNRAWILNISVCQGNIGHSNILSTTTTVYTDRSNKYCGPMAISTHTCQITNLFSRFYYVMHNILSSSRGFLRKLNYGFSTNLKKIRLMPPPPSYYGSVKNNDPMVVEVPYIITRRCHSISWIGWVGGNDAFKE